MKPEKLVLNNIGPFVGKHTVNFSVLDDFFLISGKTGSGKTTILDSITYALYGNLPGARKQVDIRHLRSDFCTSQDRCFVELIFSLNKQYYKIIRQLPFTHLTKNNTTREDGETCELYSLTNIDDEFATLISDKKQETDEKIKSLLQLSLDEFSKIVLLPQGEFAVFLRQGSTERKTMLEKLFPVSQFSQITSVIKDKRNELSGVYNNIAQQISILQESFDDSTFDEQNKLLTDELANIKNSKEKSEKRLFELSSTLTELQKQIQEHNQLQTLTNTYNTLLEQKDSMLQINQRIEKANAALEFIPDIKRLENYQENKTQNETSLISCKDQLQKATEIKNHLDSQKEQFDLLEKQNQQNEILQKTLLESIDLCTLIISTQNEYQKHTTFLNTNENKKLQLDKDLQTTNEIILQTENLFQQKEEITLKLLDLEKKQKTININSNYQNLVDKNNSLTLELENEQTILSNLNSMLEQLKTEKENENLSNLAFQLVSKLEDKKPCPVCGSLEHPSPCKSVNSNISLDEKITTQTEMQFRQSEKVNTLSKEKNILEGQLLSLKNEIDLSIKLTSEEINKDKTETNKKLKDINDNLTLRTQSLQKKSTLENELQKITVLIQDDKSKLEVLKERIDNALNTIILTTPNASLENIFSLQNELQTKINDIINSNKQNIQKISNYKDNVKNNIVELSKLQASKDFLQTSIEKVSNDIDTIFKTIDDKIHESIFSSIQEIKDCNIESNTKAQLQNQFQIWQKDIERHETLIAEKKSVLTTPLNELTEKFTNYQNENNECKKINEEAQSTISKLTQQIAILQNNKEQFDKLVTQQNKYQNDLSNYDKLFSVLSGKNTKKTDITSWVLQMYLDEIILFANKRLNTISEGRYSMQTEPEKEGGRGAKGLDIMIFDSYTGKQRPCNTLSGGETFMASISLALAISDTVQSRKGGIQLDSLFIDEGFGSLDESTLEKAISILDEIRGNRCIGIISHVGELQTRIKSGISINKTPIGSSIKLTYCSQNESSI